MAALAEPNRRRILDLLRAGERPVGELVDALEVTQPTVSRHLRVLREAGLVTARGDAQRRLYRLQPEALHTLDAWLAPYRLQWGDRPAALAGRLDRMAQQEAQQAGDSRSAAGGGRMRARHPFPSPRP